MLPERISISSAVKLEGIFLSYSLIVFFPHVILFSKFLNSVLVSIIFSFRAAAKVKVLKTELTPAMQQYGAYQIQEEQDTASKKMMELYNKNPDTVMDEIKSGNHPELESMYTNAVTNLHLGKFAAAKSYQEFADFDRALVMMTI